MWGEPEKNDFVIGGDIGWDIFNVAWDYSKSTFKESIDNSFSFTLSVLPVDITLGDKIGTGGGLSVGLALKNINYDDVSFIAYLESEVEPYDLTRKITQWEIVQREDNKYYLRIIEGASKNSQRVIDTDIEMIKIEENKEQYYSKVYNGKHNKR